MQVKAVRELVAKGLVSEMVLYGVSGDYSISVYLNTGDIPLGIDTARGEIKRYKTIDSAVKDALRTGWKSLEIPLSVLSGFKPITDDEKIIHSGDGCL